MAGGTSQSTMDKCFAALPEDGTAIAVCDVHEKVGQFTRNTVADALVALWEEGRADRIGHQQNPKYRRHQEDHA